jgi:hypothetical protein
MADALPPAPNSIAFPKRSLVGQPSERVITDIRRMLSGPSSFLNFTLAATKAPLFLRIDRIHGYAPVQDHMELFFDRHIWVVTESYMALHAIMCFDHPLMVKAFTVEGQDPESSLMLLDQKMRALASQVQGLPS